MTDVFISYAREDRDRAERLASALSGFGWSVWWDRKIIAGQSFDQAIEHELETAKSVVVLWSKHSIASEWVKNEAAVASERGMLVPAIIDSVKLPLEFRRKQTAELMDWNGDPSHSGFQALCEGVANTIGNAPRHQPVRQGRKLRWSPRWAMAMIAAIAIAAGLGVHWLASGRNSGPTPIAQSTGPESDTPSESILPCGAVAELADLVVGAYSGDVIADSKGASHSNVGVVVSKLDRSTVRVTSDDRRLDTVDVSLTRSGNQILNADDDTPFIVDLDRNPPSLLFNPHSEVAYKGNKQR